MGDGTTPAIGLSVGATTLTAVTADHTITRRPVLMLYQNRPPQVGAPAENSDSPDIDEPGLVFSGFVHRVGDPEPIVAADGTAHSAQQLLADTLHTLAHLAAGGGAPLPKVVVSHPAHWGTAGVNALRDALAGIPDWSQHPVSVVSDVTAALTALRASPGLPAHGIIVVCDFGGSGSSITLVDAANGYRQVGETVRHGDVSGESIDQALLNYVVDDLTASGLLTGTLAIGSLNTLRNQCRDAKEQLSVSTVTELPVDLPGYHGELWLTRAELDGVIKEPFDGFLIAVQDALQHNQIEQAAVSAVVAIGGGANCPAITTGLGERFGVTVISSPRPESTAAVGAALGAGDGFDVLPLAADSGPAVSVASGPAGRAAPSAPIPPPIGWSAEPVGRPADAAAPIAAPMAAASSRRVEYEAFPGEATSKTGLRPQGPLLVILACAAAVLIVGMVAVIVLRHAASNGPGTSTVTTETTTSEAPTPPPTPAPPPSQYPVFPEVPTTIPPPAESGPELEPGPEIEPEVPETPTNP